jgi:2-polyprenyl-3-methyl-5-hydroxy-6-metoxy-1,4-benzoquinol methylase
MVSTPAAKMRHDVDTATEGVDNVGFVDAAQRREVYRERLYRYYLSTHNGSEVQDIQLRLQLARPYSYKLMKYLPKDRDVKIFDLGCGYGALLYWLKQAGYHCLEGVDRSPQQVEGAHSIGLTSVVQDHIGSYLAGQRSESCDVVIASDVLEHFAKEEALRFVDEVFRVLTPTGIFILHLPNGEGFLSGCVANGDFTHELLVTRQSLGQLLRCAGFSQVSSYEDVPIVHGMLSAVRYMIWKIARTALRLIYAAQTGDLGRNLILSQNFFTVAHK